MALAYDNAATDAGEQYGVTSISTANFTIGAGANRVAIVGLFFASPVSGIAVTCGGQAGSAIAGASETSEDVEIHFFKVVNPAAGTQTAFASWTGETSASIGVVTLTGADQTTPTENGTAAELTYATSQNIVVTSATGNITVTGAINDSNGVLTSDQTRVVANWVCMDYAAGAATVTHTWSCTIDKIHLVGVSVKAASGEASIGGALNVHVRKAL